MKYQDYTKDGHKVLNLCGSDIKLAQIDALGYIKRLATLTYTDFEDWDLKSIFGTGEGILLHTARDQINQRFFAHKLTVCPINPVDQVELPDFIPIILAKIRHGKTKKANQSLQANLDGQMDNIREYIGYIKNATKKAAETKAKMVKNQELEGFDLSYQIRQILHDGFWDLWEFAADDVSFVNRVELVCQIKDEEAGLDRQVKLGFVRATFNFNNLELRVDPHYNCRVYRSVSGEFCGMNPNVFAKGDVCFGDGADIAIQYTVDVDLGKLFRLLSQVLTHYNPDAPCVSLTALENAPLEYTVAPIKPKPLEEGQEYFWQCSKCKATRAGPSEIHGHHCTNRVYDGEVLESRDDDRWDDGNNEPVPVVRMIRAIPGFKPAAIPAEPRKHEWLGAEDNPFRTPINYGAFMPSDVGSRS